MHNDILTAIDVGTTKICTIIGKRAPQGGLELMAHSVVPCDGLKKGNVTDIAGTAEAIRRSVDEASQAAQVHVDSAYVGVTGTHVSSENRWDRIDGAGERGVVTAAELAGLSMVARLEPEDSHRRILHSLPLSYSVDGLRGISSPVGMHTNNVEVESHVVTGQGPVLDRLVEAVEAAGIDVDALVLEPLASSEAVLTRKEKKRGAVVVDIGGGTTDMVAFADGQIILTTVLPVGGFQFTNDICLTYNAPYEAAEEAKVRHAHTDLHAVAATEEITLPVVGQGSDMKIPRRNICQLTRERAQELARLVKLKLKKAQIEELSDMTVVLTGGTSGLPGIDHLFRLTLGARVRLGIPHGRGLIPDDLKTPAFATGVGILLWAQDHGGGPSTRQELVRPAAATRKDGPVSRLVKQIRNLFPSHLLPVRHSN